LVDYLCFNNSLFVEYGQEKRRYWENGIESNKLKIWIFTTIRGI
jgi:hypothetical protein